MSENYAKTVEKDMELSWLNDETTKNHVKKTKVNVGF